MKKGVFIIALILSLGIGMPVAFGQSSTIGGYSTLDNGSASTNTTTTDSGSTQTTTDSQCSTVTFSNYNECCTLNSPSAQCQAIINRCEARPRPYECDQLFGQNNDIPGTAGNGPQKTAPLNNTSNGSSNGVIANTPQSGSAQLAGCSAIKFKSILDLLIWVKCIIVAAIIPLIFAAAFVFFLWGVLRFMAASDSNKKEEAKKFILWGIIALFVMVSLWGIIKILGQTLGVESTVPLLQTQSLDVKNASK